MLTSTSSADARSRHDREAGFSLAEVVVSTGIILAVLTAFLLFISGIAGTQRSAALARTADRVLASEVEKTYAVGWDHLMATSGASTCSLPGGRVSTQAIRPSDTVVKDSLTVTVTRSVTWESAGTTVACTTADKDRAELKRVTVTVSWLDAGTPQVRSVSVLRSRWVEGSANPLISGS